MKRIYILLIVTTILTMLTACGGGGGGAQAPAPSSEKAITAYTLDGTAGVINESAKTIAVSKAYGTNVTALVATFTTTGNSVKVGATTQISGTTLNNFTGAVVYTVTAADSSTVDYTVTVTVAASAVNLPKTGQAVCYDTAGAMIDCAGTGQDGDKLKGVTWPAPRFADNGNGTITDNLTGLIWLKNANCFGTGTWANALTDANTLNSGECGLTDGSVEGDWRLPNRKELRTLANYSQSNNAAWLNTQGFNSVQANYYWSSTTYAPVTGSAWFVDINGYTHYIDKASGHYVWPVRAGQ